MITYTHASHSSNIEIMPTIPALGSVIWLHGLGADGHDFVSMVSQLQLPSHLPLRFIFPHAPFIPVTVNNGYVMRAWFDIYSMQINQRIDEEGIANSVKLINSFIKNEQEKGISTEKIILGGFSQGAVITLMAGLSYPKKLAGAIALSGYLPQADTILKNRSPENSGLPVFLAHGTEDTVVPFILGQATATALEKYQVSVAWHSYAMAHSICAAEIKDIAAWLEHVLA
ncbi:MAG: estB [Gammaproteobacteria bacterium]|nr:estB [Gammaproteobacteria bacterium]